MDRGFIQKGDPVIIITGWKPGSGSTNTMRIINAVDVANKDLLAPITGNPIILVMLLLLELLDLKLNPSLCH